MKHNFVLHVDDGVHMWRDEFKCIACGLKLHYSIESMVTREEVDQRHGECSEEDQIVFKLKGTA
jgi:hypothetical protein